MKSKTLIIINIIFLILIVVYGAFTIYTLKTEIKELEENQLSVDNCELYLVDNEAVWMVYDEHIEEFCKASGYKNKSK